MPPMPALRDDPVVGPLITRGSEGREEKNKDRTATRSEGRGLEESAIARSCASVGGKDVVGEVKVRA